MRRPHSAIPDHTSAQYYLHLNRCQPKTRCTQALADGQVGKAVKLLEHVIATREKVLVEEHPDRLTSKHQPAGADRADRQMRKAVELLEYIVAVEANVLETTIPRDWHRNTLLQPYMRTQRLTRRPQYNLLRYTRIKRKREHLEDLDTGYAGQSFLLGLGFDRGLGCTTH